MVRRGDWEVSGEAAAGGKNGVSHEKDRIMPLQNM